MAHTLGPNVTDYRKRGSGKPTFGLWLSVEHIVHIRWDQWFESSRPPKSADKAVFYTHL